MREGLSAAVFFCLANISLVWGQSISVDTDATPPVLAAQYDGIAPNAEAAEAFAEVVDSSHNIWGRAEYLVWWMKTLNLPPLVTSGSASDARPGALGSPGTNVLFGGNGMDFGDRNGGRFTIGWGFDNEQQRGIEASYFFLAGRAIAQNSKSPGNPVLARPFFNVNTGLQDSSLVAYPGVINGHVLIQAPSFLQGVESNFVFGLGNTDRCRLEALAGFRFLNLQEDLHILERDQVAVAAVYQNQPIPFAGNTIAVTDLFDARNNFYGGQVGLRADLRHTRWSLNILGKVALGVTNEAISIRGSTTINTQPATSANAGLLALSSNSGVYSKNLFAIVPEVGLNLGFELTNNIRILAGYSFLYWSNIARPGDQVDTAINLNRVPTSSTFGAGGGQDRPAFSMHSTDFFAHGANFGMEFRY